jgi:hypothetical protein
MLEAEATRSWKSPAGTPTTSAALFDQEERVDRSLNF